LQCQHARGVARAVRLDAVEEYPIALPEAADPSGVRPAVEQQRIGTAVRECYGDRRVGGAADLQGARVMQVDGSATGEGTTSQSLGEFQSSARKVVAHA
jgi:hypothetical protein